MSDKQKNTIIIAIVVFLCIVYFAFVGVKSSNNNTDEPAVTTKAPAITTKTPTEDVPGTIGDFVVTVDSARITTDKEGISRLVVTYEFTNNSDEAENMAMNISHHAFQNGVEIEHDIAYMIVYKDSLENDNSDKEILPGITVKVDYVYKLANTSSDVKILLDKLITFKADPVDYTISLQDPSIRRSFIIEAGVQGEYGKIVTYNEGTEFAEEFFGYFVPYGTYTVKNIGNYPTQVNVYSDAVVTTEDGWEEPAEVGGVILVDVGQTASITVAEGQHIEVFKPTKIELTSAN